jgi:multicomponent Na+:H+ antiporter subunit B
VTQRARLAVFGVGAFGLALVLAWGIAGLPDFGHYPGPYGMLLNRVAVPERHASNVVAAVVFDYRGFDTLGEELILFAAVLGVALLLRSGKEAHEEPRPMGSEAVRAVTARLVPVAFLFGLYTIAFGPVTPGGGFQGGVLVALSLVLVYLGVDLAAFRKLTPTPVVDLLEGGAAAAFVGMGLGSLVAGMAFLQNFLPLDKIRTLSSPGSINLLNWAAGIEVASAFVLLFVELLNYLEAPE